MTVMDRWTVDDLLATVTRAAPYETLTREVLEGVLGMLAGAYPSDEFAELKPRVVWDRVTDVVEGRRDARVVAVTSGGTIPDRGLFGVFMVGEAGTPGRRVGELDEEMVYELRAGMHGDVIVLGASSLAGRGDRPRPGDRQPGAGRARASCRSGTATPSAARSSSGGRSGAFVGEIEADLARGEKGRAAAVDPAARAPRPRRARGRQPARLPRRRARRRPAPCRPTGAIVVERFRDELGDWRLCLLTPFGGRVHAPWSLAIEARLGERLGMEVQTIWSDDGIAIRLPEGDAPLDGIEALLFPDPDEVEDLVVGQLGELGAVRQPVPRERRPRAAPAAPPARAPGRRSGSSASGRRTCWRSPRRYGSFPILVETYRECLSDVFDLPALREILAGVAAPRDRGPLASRRPRASPFASSLLFDYVAAYMYDGDTPLAERRAGALTLDRDLLRELLGQEELRELLDPDALADLELTLQALTDDRRATTLDRRPRPPAPARRPGRGRGRGPDRGRRRGRGPVAGRAASRRGAPSGSGSPARSAGSRSRTSRAIATASGSRRRSASRPRSSARPSAPLEGLLARWARTHGPFLTPEPARRWGLPVGVVEEALERLLGGRLAPARRVPPGRRRARVVRPGGPAAPAPAVAGAAAARGRAGRSGGAGPVPAGVARRGRGRGRAAAVPRARPRSSASPRSSTSWPALPIPASVLERDVLPARIPGYQPRLLDELGALGEVAWVGRGSLGRDDGRIALVRPGREVLRPAGLPDGVERAGRAAPRGDPRAPRRAAAPRSTASSTPRPAAARDREVLDALWDLVWAGEVTNDTFAPLRALRWKRSGSGGDSRGRAAGPADRARTARGRRALVAGRPARARPASPTERLHALSLALLERHGVLTREAVAAEGVEGGFSAVYPVLRALEEAGRIRRGYFVDGLGAAQFALAGALDRLRAVREPADRAGERARPPPRRRRSGQPVRRRARRGRAGARTTGGRSSGPPARTSCSSTGWPRCTSSVAAPRSRPCPPPTTRRSRAAAAAALRRARRRRPRPRARRSARSTAMPVGESPFRDALARGRLRRPAIAASCSVRSPGAPSPARGPRAGPLSARGRHALPDRGRPPAVPRRAAGDRGAGRGPGPVPQVERVVGHEITAVEALGKNLLIRFDNGLELRTHLRMNGIVAPLPARASAGDGRRPGPASSSRSRAPSRSASTRRSSSCSSAGRGAPPVARPARARTCSRRTSTPAEARPPAARPGAGRDGDRRGAPRPAGAGRDRQRLQERDRCSSSGSSRSRRSPTSTTRRSRRLVATARRLLARERGRGARPGARDDRPAIAARPGRSTSTAAPAGRAAAAGRPIRAPRQGTDLPRTTYWCPTCQGPTRASIRGHVRALRRPGRRAVPPRRALAVRRAAGAVRDRRLRLGRGLARRRRAPRLASRHARVPRRSRPRGGRATETTSALVHLRRPSRLSTLDLPDTQPFDDPAGRFAFSHNGDLRDYRGLRAAYRAPGPDPRPRRHRGRRALARGRLAPGEPVAAPPRRRSTTASAARRTWPS